VVVSLLLTFPVVWLLIFFKVGQPVREEGPSSHKEKAGTPTMGGIGFVLAIIILSLILINIEFNPPYTALILLTLAFAAIGLADDLIKVVRRKNMGLTFWQKIFFQIAAAGLFSVFLGGNILFLLFATFVIVGSANATNLTDGLNGLLAGTAGIAFLSFAVLAGKLNAPEAAVFSLICSGAVFSFLYFNFPRAKVFMGDVGSLATGAALAGLAVILHKELLLIVIGGVFVIEALSVIIQVASYKLFKRRIFKMAPLHHHFELMGFKETAIVISFWVAALVLGVAGAWI